MSVEEVPLERTNQTSPLRIAEAPCGEGVIGLTICPGKCGPSVFGSPWRRDLTADVTAIARWGASCVLTLLQDHELHALRVSQLAEAVRRAGIDWLHAPIEDLGVPDAGFERRWSIIGHKLRTSVRRGERVLIHCRGGRGRAGTIAARLLVECGFEVEAAISLVRAMRPGAIETRAQEEHVRASHPVEALDVSDRALGCLVGGAVGDGFGYAIEFDRLSEIRQRYGSDGLTRPKLDRGKLVVSDDTQMTLFTAEAVARSEDQDAFVGACRDAYLRWYRSQTEAQDADEDGLLAFPSLWARRAPGMTCMSALAQGGAAAGTPPINDSKGCGGVMRVAPIGLRLDWSDEQVFELAAQAAAITHGHPSGYYSAAALAVMIRRLADGDGLRAAIQTAERLLSLSPAAEETLIALQRAVALAEATTDKQDVAGGLLGDGWVGEEALAIALYSCLTGADFAEVMRIAANHDGDSDSTASIAGQLSGAELGLDAIPWTWIQSLDVFDALGHAATGLLELNRGGIQ